ncbi:MAG: septal ring lytic transglycosylase RlpA family protein [Desulfuromonadia bacterium]
MAVIRSRGRWGILGLSLLTVLATTLPVQAEDHGVSTPNHDTAATEGTPAAVDQKGETGLATYYARRYNGRRTTSGARYNPEELTAAHQSLPLGKRVKVVNLANGREIIVTVIDRCRPRKVPFIDLSRKAARTLGFLRKGVAKVRIIPLPDPA